jgi:hypothetical protein
MGLDSKQALPPPAPLRARAHTHPRAHACPHASRVALLSVDLVSLRVRARVHFEHQVVLLSSFVLPHFLTVFCTQLAGRLKECYPIIKTLNALKVLVRKRKDIFLRCHFALKMYSFTKTGSGQT